MKDKIYITKAKEYEIFCSEIKYWLLHLGLVNFESFIRHEKLVCESRAACNFNIENKIAVFSLNEEWANIVPTHKEICKTAFHEVCEVLLGQMYVGILDLNVTNEEIDGRAHGVIRVLENTWFKESYAQRFEKKCCGGCKSKKKK
jgi:hypothetical protein